MDRSSGEHGGIADTVARLLLAIRDQVFRIKISNQQKHWISVLWVTLLAVYIILGANLVPFHGDESMFIHSSRDFYTLFVEKKPQDLAVTVPIEFDTDAHLRILNGSVQQYVVGAVLMLQGYSKSDLPGMWIWYLSFEENETAGNLPQPDMLKIARIVSSTFAAASIAVLFLLCKSIANYLTAFIASGMLALHPIFLLNSRRAMQMGVLFFFGFLSLYSADKCARAIKGGRNIWSYFILLSVSSAFAVASKHTGVLFAAIAFAWVLVVAIRQSAIHRKKTLLLLLAAAILSVVLFAALSPGIWHSPFQGLSQSIQQRRHMLNTQVDSHPIAPISLAERLRNINTISYMVGPDYYEVSFWQDYIADQVASYSLSPLSGLGLPTLIGYLLSAITVISIIRTISTMISSPSRSSMPLLIWLGVTICFLLLNSLPWQRNYIYLIPISIIFLAVEVSRWLSSDSRTPSQAG